MTDGAFRVDMHVKVLDDRIVERAKARGLDALVYAPHFTRFPAIKREATHYTDDDLLVVPAREVFTGTWRSRKHVLALGLSSGVPDFISLRGAMAEFDRQDAAVLVPHPGFATVSLDASNIRRYRDLVDAVEVYNLKLLGRQNRRATAIAQQTGLPSFGSSYAHLGGSVGEVWTEFDQSFGSASGIVAAIRRGAPRQVFHRSGVGPRLRRCAEIAHLFYENTISKAATFASGPTPTNPHHPAYDSRFDSVSMYRPPPLRSFDLDDADDLGA